MTSPVGHMPAEFATHERTVMCWPARADLYGNRFAEAEDAHAQVASAIAEFEPVTIIAAPRYAERASRCASDAINVVEMPLDDAWFRDSGPVYVLDSDGQRVAIDFVFNGWGRKFVPIDDDALAARRWAECNGDDVRSVDVVLEGGSLNSDGRGTIVTTMQCLLNPNRNPSMSMSDIEDMLRKELGAESLVWLPHGLALDHDTDGHVDNVAAFAPGGRLVLQGCDDTTEKDHELMFINRRVAERSLDAGGDPFDIVDVPVLPFVDTPSGRVVVPYLNYYVGNGFVLVPTCGHSADADMLGVIESAYPGRRVIGLSVGEILAVGGGGIHCITQQVPATPR